MNPILQQAPSNDETLSSAAEFFSTFGIAELFNRSAGKGKGIPPLRILQFLFALVFLRKTFFEMMRENSLPWSKDTFYRFLSESRINWRRFLLLVAKKLLETFFLPLTVERRDRVLVLDDSAYSRNRSKKVELLSKCYDHCDHRHFRGFRMLSLGWSDGRSFLPLAFSLLASAKEENRLFDARETDGRTRGAHRRKEAVMTTPEAALVLLDAVLSNGMKADFLLFDSMVCHQPVSALRAQERHPFHRHGQGLQLPAVPGSAEGRNEEADEARKSVPAGLPGIWNKRYPRFRACGGRQREGLPGTSPGGQGGVREKQEERCEA